jgi:hypothetical protein
MFFSIHPELQLSFAMPNGCFLIIFYNKIVQKVIGQCRSEIYILHLFYNRLVVLKINTEVKDKPEVHPYNHKKMAIKKAGKWSKTQSREEGRGQKKDAGLLLRVSASLQVIIILPITIQTDDERKV